MADIFLDRLDHRDELFKFFADLEPTGAHLVNWYEVVPYSGDTKHLPVEICIIRGLFSTTTPLAAAEREGDLQQFARFLRSTAPWNGVDFGIRYREHTLQQGAFSIVRRTAVRGGDEQAINDVVARFGGTEEDTKYLLKHTEEETLVYLLSSTPDEARAIAEAVSVGANKPASDDEVKRVVQLMEKWLAERPPTADRRAVILADVWQQLAVTTFRRHWGISHERFSELLEEWKALKTVLEPPRDRMTQAAIDGLFRSIAGSDQLTEDDKAVADFGLLAVLEGKIPSQDWLACLGKVFGVGFVQTILDKQAQLGGRENAGSDHLDSP